MTQPSHQKNIWLLSFELAVAGTSGSGSKPSTSDEGKFYDNVYFDSDEDQVWFH
jgi:hypothetical protein